MTGTRMRQAWIATLVSVAFLSSGCFSHHRESMYDDLERKVDAPPAGMSPDGTPLTGNYDDGVRDGELAAEDANVTGYFVLGAVTAPLVVLCIVAAASSKGGGGGDCGGGGGGVSTGGTAVVVAPQYVPVDARYRTTEFVTGYNQGYETRLNQRQGTAFGFGFLTGAVISAIGVGIWLSMENNREETEDEIGNHATSTRRRGLIEF
jgi:hypothetical protein